jgi:TonB family protein
LVSFLGDLQRSAKVGVPVYEITGGPGFLWVATYNQDGRGALRFLTIDASQIGQSQPQSESNRQISGLHKAMSNWERQVIDNLSQNKRYPADALSRQEQGTAIVSFTLDRNGNLLDSQIKQSSGSGSLDREALELLSRINRFPPLPSDYTKGTFSMTVPIRFSLHKAPDQQPFATQTPPSAPSPAPSPPTQSTGATASTPQPPTSSQPASACDTYAASEFDTQRKSPGVSQEKIDPNLAVPACESAVQQYPDDARLNFQLGRAYDKANNFSAALAQFRKAADQNFAPAQNMLGFMYQKGRGVALDDQQAIASFRIAAEQNFAPAQHNLGVMYENGRGVTQDYQQAVAWYRKAVEQNLGAAQFNLGLMYERGLGVTQDYQQAIAWYQKGADQGQKEAKAKLDEVKARLGALPAGDSSIASSRPTLEQAAAYILWSGDVDLSQMTTNAEGSVNTPFHNLFGSPLATVPAGITKVIDRADCVVEMVMQAVQGMQPEKHVYVYFNRANGFRDEEVYAPPLGNFTKIWATSESPVACASGGGTRLTGELLTENYSCLTDVPLVGGIKPQNVERVHKALDYLYSRFWLTRQKRTHFRG